MQPDFSTLKPISNQPDFNTLTPVTEPQKATGLKAFIQDTARAVLKLPTTAASIGAQTIAFGAQAVGRPDIAQRIDKSIDEGIDYGYFGNVKPIESVPEAIGTGAEIGSYAIGGGGATTAVKTGLKGLVKQGLKEGVKTGAASGGVFSFGQSMQEAENKPMDVAYNTLFGIGLGGVAGGVLNTAIPLVARGTKEALKFTKVPELQTKLSEGYQKIFNPNARQIKADTRFGNNSFEFLAQEMPDLPITVDKNGKIEADAAIEMAKQKYAAEATAYKPIIRNSGKYLDIDSVIANAKRAAKQEFDGTDLTKAEQQIENEINAYLSNTPQDVNVTASGKRFVTLSRADDIKSYSWARGKGWGTPEAEVWNDTNNIIGHSIKDAIEKELPDAPIKAMNRRLGQWKNAIDMLEKRNGQVSGSGGKFSKLLTTRTGSVVGSIIGAGTGDDNRVMGGLGGATAGFMTASTLAALMANPNVRLYIVRQMLQRLNKAGRSDMIKEAEDILRQQAQRYMLPAAGKTSYVEKPIILPTSARETNIGLDEVKNAVIGKQIFTPDTQPRLNAPGKNPIQLGSPKNLQATAPNVAPTIQDTKNVNISNTVDQTVNKSMKEINIEKSREAIAQYKKMIENPESDAETIAFAKRGIEGEMNYLKNNGAQQAFGGVAGLEIKKDENGKLVVGFNPEKALAGVIGMTAYNKLGASMQNEVKTNLAKRLKDRIVKELSVFDDNAVKVTGMLGNRLEVGDADALLGLSRIKEKALTKNLSTSDVNEAIGLFKKQGVDIMKEEAEATMKLAQSTSKVESNLIQEAKKYKSAEEFVKAKPTYYRGTTAPQVGEIKPADTYGLAYGKGVYLASDSRFAKDYGPNIKEYFVDWKKPLEMNKPAPADLISQVKKDFPNFREQKGMTGEDLYEELPLNQNEANDYLQKLGYDGLKDASSGYTAQSVVFDTSSLKTKSQLTDIWKKANKK